MDDKKINQIVERVISRLDRSLAGAEAAPTASSSHHRSATTSHAGYTSAARYAGHHAHGVFETVDTAIEAAGRAFEAWQSVNLKDRKRMISAVRQALMAEREKLAHMAVNETGLGRISDKIGKNALAIQKTPGPEILQPEAFSGDEGLALLERAPFGIIGAITPCTNASETIINNGIGMISGGNVVVFNVHPSARGVCNYTVNLMNEVIVREGGPDNTICSIDSPTIASANALMKHPKVRLVVVTGGPGVVKAAMNSGKRAIAAGPGNPPVVVDETANIIQAAQGIIDGASIDNNIVCIAEKELIVVEDVADMLKRELLNRHVVEISGRDLKKLEQLLITPDDHVNKKFVGKNPSVMLKEIGIRVGDEIRLILCEVGEKHPFVQHELLTPVLGMIRVPDVDQAIEMSVRVEHGFRHTSVMYSRNIEKLHKMARMTDTSIFVKNAPSVAGIGGGGEGYTSWTIASPTGEGLTTAKTFTRERRCTLKEYFRII